MNNKEKKILGEFYDKKEQINKRNNQQKKIEKIEKLKKNNFEETTKEKQLYKKFCEIAKQDPDKKFKFKHLEELGIEADVIVIYGKKGIGKTYQISQIIKKLAEEDRKAEIILVRNTVSEFQALEKQLTTNYCPIYMKARTSNNPPLFHKTLLKDNEPRYMGFCVALNGFSLESAKGAEYPNIRLIIWDECTNTGKGTAGYDSTDISRFISFLDSIIRNKTNTKIYIFGNFHRNTDGKIHDTLLEELKIPYECKLKIRQTKSKDLQNTSTLLYINTGELYSGIDTNAKISLFSNEQTKEDLYTNLPKSNSNMVGALHLFYSHKPIWGLLFHDGEQTLILLLSSFKRQKNIQLLEINYMIHMEIFQNNDKWIHNIFTSNAGLYNEFNGQGIKMITKWEETLLIKDIYDLCLQRSIYYSCDSTRKLFTLQISKWDIEHNLSNISFFKNWETQKNKTN